MNGVSGQTAQRPASPREDEAGVVIIFPGQGSQSLGMAGQILRVHTEARARFHTASEILGYDLLSVIEEGPSERLDDTWHSQPAVYTASLAWYDALRAKWEEVGRSLRPLAMSGHSLGQITAFAAANALDFEQGLQLVAERARLMREAAQRRPGGMASIIGLRDRVLRALVGEAAGQETLVLANDNCPGHTVVSGDESALQRLMRLAEEHGARRVVRLPISIASHSPLMADAQQQFREVVDAVVWRDPAVPIISNISAGLILTKEAIVEELHESLCKPVRWTDSVKAMASQGATLFVEAGPGDVLSQLVRRIARSAWTFPLADEEEGLARRDYPDMSTGIPR